MSSSSPRRKPSVTNSFNVNTIKELTDSDPLPLIRTGVSIAADLKMGWKPRNPFSGAPIPLYYDFTNYKLSTDGKSKHELIYYGPRIPNSINVHKLFSSKK